MPWPENGTAFCPRVFDGWSCWNDTPAGQVAFTSCPEYIIGFDPNRQAHRDCLSNGSWFHHPDTNVPWSNYTSCIDSDDLEIRQLVNSIYMSGYFISVIALIISMIIFVWFKSLRCTRITIHKNLFLSFIINNLAWITWQFLIDKKYEIFMRNSLGCQILHVLLQYFLVCNYFWMFCEGLYLHTILVKTFVNEKGIMKWLYIIGWVSPAKLTIIYALSRSQDPEEIILCWLNDSHFTFILVIPVCVSIVVNLFFLINILRVLITKLRSVNSPDVNQKKKAVRATLILIPLLGLHFLVMPFRPEQKSPGELVYQIIAAVVTSFQGLCVACLFCFCNSEVISLITKRWSQRRGGDRRRSYSVAATSVSYVSRNSSKLISDNCEEHV